MDSTPSPTPCSGKKLVIPAADWLADRGPDQAVVVTAGLAGRPCSGKQYPERRPHASPRAVRVQPDRWAGRGARGRSDRAERGAWASADC
jgi:hypothetical protein